MAKRNQIDRLLATELSGREKVKALLKARGFTFQGYAQHRGLWPEQVKATVYGQRPYPEVRELLAQDLGISREEIDRLLDGEAVVASPAVVRSA